MRPKATVFHFILTVWREPSAGDDTEDDDWRGFVRPVTPRPESDAVRGKPFVGLGALRAAVRSGLDQMTRSEP